MEYEDFDNILETVRFPTPQGIGVQHQQLLSGKFVRSVMLQGGFVPTVGFAVSSQSLIPQKEEEKKEEKQEAAEKVEPHWAKAFLKTIDYQVDATVVPLGVVSGSASVALRGGTVRPTLRWTLLPPFLQQQTGEPSSAEASVSLLPPTAIPLAARLSAATSRAAAASLMASLRERSLFVGARADVSPEGPVAAVRVGCLLGAGESRTQAALTATTAQVVSYQVATGVAEGAELAVRTSHYLDAQAAPAHVHNHQWNAEVGLRYQSPRLPLLAAVRADTAGNLGALAGIHVGLAMVQVGVESSVHSGSSFGVVLDFS